MPEIYSVRRTSGVNLAEVRRPGRVRTEKPAPKAKPLPKAKKAKASDG